MIELDGRLGQKYRHDMAGLLLQSYSEVILSVSRAGLSDYIIQPGFNCISWILCPVLFFFYLPQVLSNDEDWSFPSFVPH